MWDVPLYYLTDTFDGIRQGGHPFLPINSSVGTFLVHKDHEGRRHEIIDEGPRLPRCGGPRCSAGPLRVHNVRDLIL